MRIRLVSALVVGSALSWISLSADAPAQSRESRAHTEVLTSGARLYLGAATLPANAPTESLARARVTLQALVPDAARVELAATDVARFGDGDTIVRFDQTHKGLPVIGRGAAVRMNARGENVMTSARLAIDLPSIVPTIASGEAARAARAVTPFDVT